MSESREPAAKDNCYEVAWRGEVYECVSVKQEKGNYRYAFEEKKPNTVYGAARNKPRLVIKSPCELKYKLGKHYQFEACPVEQRWTDGGEEWPPAPDAKSYWGPAKLTSDS